jgi:hypothetical protein
MSLPHGMMIKYISDREGENTRLLQGIPNFLGWLAHYIGKGEVARGGGSVCLLLPLGHQRL